MEHVCPQLGTPVEGRVPYFSSMEEANMALLGSYLLFHGIVGW